MDGRPVTAIRDLLDFCSDRQPVPLAEVAAWMKKKSRTSTGKEMTSLEGNLRQKHTKEQLPIEKGVSLFYRSYYQGFEGYIMLPKGLFKFDRWIMLVVYLDTWSMDVNA